jgi:membrane protease YdiL (CAAX protease family)
VVHEQDNKPSLERPGKPFIHPAALIGLALTLGSPLIQFALNQYLLTLLPSDAADTIGLLIMWVLMLVVLGIARFCEGVPPSEFGFRRCGRDRRLFIREFVFAALFGIFLMFTLGPLSLAVRGWITGELPQVPDDLSSLPSAQFFVLAWFTGSFTEEVLFRSYAIERMSALIGHRRLAGLIAAFLFTIQHLFGWDWIHVLTVVFPGAIILTLTYLWRSVSWSMLSSTPCSICPF